MNGAARGKEIRPMRSRWKGTMTDRERFNRQMHYQSVDRCFNMEFGYWEENFDEWDIFIQNGIRTNEEADRLFNFDTIDNMSGCDDMHPPFPETEVSRTADKRVLQNRDGLLAEVPVDGHSTIPHYLQSSITTPDDWARIKDERFRLDDPVRKLDVPFILSLHPNDRTYPLGIDCGSMIGRVRDMLTFEGLAYAVYDYPEMVEDMVETRCQLVLNSLDQLLPYIQFDYASGWEDICFKNGPIVSAPFFRDVITPRYKRIHERLKKYGIDLWYTDCDGDVRPILPFLMEGGINCLFPFEVNGCAHPGELLDQYQGQLRIMGGVDKIQLGAGRPAIRAYLQSLEKYVEQGGFIPFCDHRCPPNVDPQDYLYYLDLKEKMFGMG